MSDTPYFDEYERRRRARIVNPLHTIDNVSDTFTGRGTVSTLSNINITNCNTAGTVITLDNSIDSSWYSSGVTGSGTYEVYPKYRLQKTYTFIGDIRVIQDCFIESKASSYAEWVQVDESFNAYSFV